MHVTGRMRSQRVVIIGAGVAGLVAALLLAARGLQVVVLERAEAPGGKMREINIGGARIDAGPTVFTLRTVFDEILAEVGVSLADYVTLRPVEALARHVWGPDQRLDLFSDIERSADAIGRFAGSTEADGYRAFCARARRIYETLEHPFIRSPRPNLLSLLQRTGMRGHGGLWRLSPFATLWDALGEHFTDPRLRQLFGRYATYCGSSPFQAPATLMLVAHVEREGVWVVEGGMHRVATALAQLAAQRGATFHYNTAAAEIVVDRGHVTGVTLTNGERLEADAVVANADVAAIATARLGGDAAAAVPPVPPAGRSLSALTWTLLAETEGFPLLRHTIFFSGDYAAEFDDIFARARLPRAPTVYVCAQDREGGPSPSGPERLLCLVNAPPIGDRHSFAESEIWECEQRTFSLLDRCGLRTRRRPESTVITTPADFERLFPATGGALYGQASHGWTSSFRRLGSRSRLRGLYLAGGSVHPGPGVPMAAVSGRLAAASLLADLASTRRSRPTAMSGGISMR